MKGFVRNLFAGLQIAEGDVGGVAVRTDSVTVVLGDGSAAVVDCGGNQLFTVTARLA